MSSPTNFFDLPAVRHPVRWGAIALGIVVVLVATAPSASAHAEHAPLPEGFEARLGQVVDAAGQPASPDVDFAISSDGARVGVTYRGDAQLVVFGEQANEPLLRLAGGTAEVNAASPQAVQVEGATVDPAAAAELIDLVWERVPPAWEPLPNGSVVAFMDHRAVPGHTPVREEWATGDVAATWRIPFTHDGSEYTLTGDVVAVEVPGGSGFDLTVGIGGVLFVLLIVVFAVRGWRGIMGRRPDPSGPSGDAADDKELVSAG